MSTPTKQPFEHAIRLTGTESTRSDVAIENLLRNAQAELQRQLAKGDPVCVEVAIRIGPPRDEAEQLRDDLAVMTAVAAKLLNTRHVQWLLAKFIEALD